MPSKKQHLEIEVKFFLDAPDAMRDQLVSLGAEGRPRVFETNRRYEVDGEGLRNRGQLLRLRHDTTWRLTFKSRPPRQDPQFKIYRELEITLSDGEIMDAILSSLGFQAVQIYEKWRETYVWGNVELCIDILPFGTFLEIEGPKADIQSAAAALGFRWDKRILKNYLAIFEILRHKENLDFNDLTFSNFEKGSATIAPYLDQLYAASISDSPAIR